MRFLDIKLIKWIKALGNIGYWIKQIYLSHGTDVNLEAQKEDYTGLNSAPQNLCCLKQDLVLFRNRVFADVIS